ncbi:MAG: beta-N-acetylhexosaminidase [Firmicutes bacterium]|nr:beta-N-acetylhexosaminidase [Bacillota bacterium]
MVKSMTLEAKIGQLLMFGFSDTKVTPFIKRFITEHNLGGVIHFARNVSNVQQLAELNRELQELTKDSPSGAGLFIATDQEGGTVARLTNGVAVAPSAMALGACGSEEYTEKVCQVSGQELRATGVNMNLAPVVDVNSNPENPVIGVRSFGEDPHTVAALGAAAIRGYQKNVAAVAKHFPGHGDTNLDSHHDLPVIAHDRGRLERVELLPFRAAIEEGVAAIMTAHVVFPAIEPVEGLPATLSYQVLTKLLREELGFDGLIMTDCMEMMAIKGTFGTVEAAVMTIEAGADLVLISHTEELQQQAFDALVAAVKSGRISEQRIDESVERVMKAKERFRLLDSSPEEVDLGVVGSSEHMQVMRDAIRNSITLVKDVPFSLPLGNERVLVVEFNASAATLAEDVLVDMGNLAKALTNNGLPQMENIVVNLTVSPQEEEAVLARAQACNKVVVATGDAHLNPSQLKLVQSLISQHDRVIAVGTRTPYELQAFPNIPTYVAAYGSRPLVWEEVAQILLGRYSATGRLPVSIPGLNQ